MKERVLSTVGARGMGPVAVAILVASSFVSACGEGQGGVAWTTSVDTVGGTVRVVNTPPATGGGPMLVGEELFRIGTAAGEGVTSFGEIRSIAVLDDGRFAVADRQYQEIRLFDGEGRHVRTFGGEGAGPGELLGMQGAYVDHEGLLRVAEVGNARLSVFHPDNGFVTSFPFRVFRFGFHGPWEAAVDSEGRTFVNSAGAYGPPGRFWNMLRIYDPSMTQLDSIPYHDYTDDIQRDDLPWAWRVASGPQGPSWRMVPFFNRARDLVVPTGEFWSSTEGTPELEVVRWRPGGDTAVVLLSRRQPEPVGAAERDSVMAEIRAELAETYPSPPTLDASRVPESKPPLYGLSLDDRTRLWVRVTDPVVETTGYDVFNEDGSYAETVALPFRVDQWVPPVVHGDTLWAVVTDEVDVQYVVRALLTRRRGEGSGTSDVGIPD